MKGKEKDRKVFLLAMSCNGIKNIEKDIHIGFYKDTITKKFSRSKYNIKGIYGENGVGKSAIITAAYIFRELLTNPNYLNNPITNDKILYLLNKKTEKANIEFEYLIESEEINIYKVGFEIKENAIFKNEIVHEYGYVRKPNTKYKLLYETIDGELKYNGNKKFNEYITEKTKNILKEKSFICSVANSNIDDKYNNDLYDIENIFVCGIYTYVYIDSKDTHDDYMLSKYIGRMLKDPEDIVKVSKPLSFLTCSGPINVDAKAIVSFRKEIESLSNFIREFKSDLNRINIDETPNKDSIICDLIFEYKDYKVAAEFESTGIKKLVELYIAFKCVSQGYVVFIDELDANIHDYYLCKLLEYVGEYSKGQLCFTTHNLGPMRVLKDYKKSIDFISRDGSVVPWIKNGNYDVSSLYKQGKIDKSPFNIESFDFLSVFEG